MTAINCSKESAKRFIKLFLGIKDTAYWFHQTLTFKEQITNEGIAKKHLKKLLDSLGRFYPEMASLFVQEHQERGAIHFHLIFMFFGVQPLSPDKMRARLSDDVWKRWKKILKSAPPDRHANKLTMPLKRDLGYLLKGVCPVKGRPRSNPHWFGIRNSKVIRSNSSPVSKQVINRNFKSVFFEWFSTPLVPYQSKPLPPEFTRRDLRKLKSEIDAWERAKGKIDWQSFKQRALGTNNKVSDQEYTIFRNRERDKKMKENFEKKRGPKSPEDDEIYI